MEIEDIVKSKNIIVKNPDTLKKFMIDLIDLNPLTLKDFDKYCKIIRKKYKFLPRKIDMIYMYRKLVNSGELKLDENMEKLMIKKLTRKSSGIAVITVLTSPYPEYMKNGKRVKQKFSCGKNCFYCPLEGEIRLKCTNIGIVKETEKYTFFRLQTNEKMDEVRVITYLILKDETKVQVAASYDYSEEENGTSEFTISVMNKFKDKLINETEFIAVKIEQPRSYISTEPAVRRANANNFDPVFQFYDRAQSLHVCGHIIDKLEILVLGGTWSHYPVQYQEEFIRDIYYSANTFYDDIKREKYSLENEIFLNQSAKSRIIGLTLETRPDAINKYEIRRFRKYGCTRVQLGVQHIHDDVLKKINRGCYIKDTKKALFLLKQNGYKVDIHLMPDLYGSTYEKDMDMFDRLLGIEKIEQCCETNYMRYFKLFLYLLFYLKFNYLMCWDLSWSLIFLIPQIIIVLYSIYYYYHNSFNIINYQLTEPELQADQWKIYPTEVVRWTKIYDLYFSGEYKPYAEEINKKTGNKRIVDLILHAKTKVYPWIRLNRVIRDIPTTEIFGGNQNISLREQLQKELIRRGTPCKCIRCREIKSRKIDINDVKIMVRKYGDNKADEYFISFESHDNSIIYGFCRLRLNKSNEGVIFEELKDAALIRELHVYGLMVPHNSDKTKTQHIGFGKKLLKAAENIACDKGFKKIAVISGIGVREYYQKNGYYLDGTYMTKLLPVFS